MGDAKGFTDQKYSVPCIVNEIGNITMNINEGKMEQQLTVSKNLRRGTVWQDVTSWMSNLDSEFLNRPDWKLVNVQKLSTGLKRVHFRPVIVPKKEEPFDAEAFAELVKELELTDDNLRKILHSMFVNVFVEKTLKKFIDSKDLEFISDEHWFYLRAGDTAYRV
jgi:hypothetical protein